jgi:hypothetical protein
LQAAPRPPTEIVRINPEKLTHGGLDPGLESEANRSGFSEMLQKGFLPVNLSHPGLRIMNIDPPILTVQNFLPEDVCDNLIEVRAIAPQQQLQLNPAILQLSSNALCRGIASGLSNKI